MENNQNQNTQKAELNGSSTEHRKSFTTVVINRKSLGDWGFKEAGPNFGDPVALDSHLRSIEAGQLVDETYTEAKERERKDQIEEKVITKEKEKISKEKDISHLTDVVIREKEKQKEEHEEEINRKHIKLAEGTIQSEYNAVRFWLYVTLCVFITLFVIFFYASAINASFFRSMQQMVNNISGDDINLMLNSIFDVNGIMHFGPQSIFTYLGAFIFFGFGILPHIFYHQVSKFTVFKVSAAIIVCLVIDSLLAYKIDSGIHELKQMMGVGDSTWTWYKSVNFYLVLAFGFGTYILWGFIFEEMLCEHKKTDVNACTQILIDSLEKKIRKIKNTILEDKKEQVTLQKQVQALEIEISKLRKDMEASALRPDELLRNMEIFYNGWLRYVNGTSDNGTNKSACEKIYKTFYERLKYQLN